MVVYTKDTRDTKDTNEVLQNENIQNHNSIPSGQNNESQNERESNNNRIAVSERANESVSVSFSNLIYDTHKNLLFKNRLFGCVTYTKLSKNQKRKYLKYGVIPSQPSHNLKLWKYSLNHIQIKPKAHKPTPAYKTYIALSPKSFNYHIVNYHSHTLIDTLSYDTLSYIKENNLKIEDSNGEEICFDIFPISSKTRSNTNTISFLNNSSQDTTNEDISKLFLFTLLGCRNNKAQKGHIRGIEKWNKKQN